MNKRTIRTKRIWSMLLAAVLIVSVVTPAVAATARATTMKLEKTEGTVTLKTQNGSSRKPTNGMRLLNGNTIDTAASSYAHISLDGTKAVKLDQNSSTTVRQSGKQLELLVKSGQLFFNVSEKLTQKESLNIRTSSMVAGIRGTCGVVEKVNPAVSKLYLIEGQVTLGTGENATTVYGGQTATVILRPKNETGESGGSGDNGNTEKDMEQKVYVDKLTEKAVPVFAITEILSNPVLQQKIEATTELKIEKLKEALAESQKEPGAEEKEEEKKPEETTSSGGSYGGSSSGSGTGGVSNNPEHKETTLDGSTVTAGAIKAAFDSPGCNKVILTAGTNGDAIESVIGDSVEIPENKTLVVGENVFFYTESITVGIGGTLENSGILSNSSTITNSGTITNDGTITDTESAKGMVLTSGSALENNRTITGSITLENGSTLTNSGTMTATSSWSVTNATIDNTRGTINMGMNAISVKDSLNLSSVGTITGNGGAVISLAENGTLTLGSGNSSGSSISNASTEDSHYAIAVSSGSSITWNDEKATISTGSTGATPIGNTIQGLTYENGTVIDKNNILQENIVGQLTWVTGEKMLCFPQ